MVVLYLSNEIFACALRPVPRLPARVHTATETGGGHPRRGGGSSTHEHAMDVHENAHGHGGAPTVASLHVSATLPTSAGVGALQNLCVASVRRVDLLSG